MFKNTFEQTPDYVLSTYGLWLMAYGYVLSCKDNVAVMKGFQVSHFFATPANGQYDFHQEQTNIPIKVETHSRPTAISTWASASYRLRR